MSFVVVETSTVVCRQMAKVTLNAGQSKLKVGGAKVLVMGDLSSAPVSVCPTPVMPPPPGPVSKPCLAVLSAIGGVATKLTVQGKSVLLADINGTTDGMVANVIQTWSVQDAGQTKLKTV